MFGKSEWKCIRTNCENTKTGKEGGYCPECGKTLYKVDSKESKRIDIKKAQFKSDPNYLRKEGVKSKVVRDRERESRNKKMGSKGIEGFRNGKKISLILEDEGIRESKSGFFTGWDKGGNFFRYLDITSIEIKKGLVLSTIKISVPSKKIKIENVDKNFGETFVQNAQRKMTEVKTKPKESSGVDNTSISPMDEIKKAKDLLDAGAISQDQFEETRDKYLKKI